MNALPLELPDTSGGGLLAAGTLERTYEPWPPGKGKPYTLYVVGSWNDNVPTPMQWDSGIFSCSITLGAGAMEIFQLILNKDWDQTFYPSIPDATMTDEYEVMGPDAESDGRSWLIGSPDGTVGKPGDTIDIVVSVDSKARLANVEWHLSF
uniref:Uncharacterized protein n=1 Tax=Alexandrium andersonii TaxID=327968 RepID=A0A7S2GM98_9DINO